MAISEQKPLGSEQAFYSHRATSMQSPGTDAYFGAQAESVAIRHASARIVEHTRTVYILHEIRRDFI